MKRPLLDLALTEASERYRAEVVFVVLDNVAATIRRHSPRLAARELRESLAELDKHRRAISRYMRRDNPAYHGPDHEAQLREAADVLARMGRARTVLTATIKAIEEAL